MSVNPYQTPDSPTPPPEDPFLPSRNFVFFVISLVVLSYFVKFLHAGKLEQSALFYTGVPALLAILLSFAPTSQSPMGAMMKGTTFLLLFAGIVFSEGLVCLLLAAPIFYLVALTIGLICHVSSEKRRKRAKLRCSTIGVFILFSLEGVTEQLSFDRDETITIQTTLTLTPNQVLAKLNQGPNFENTTLPLFLSLGFPTPQSIQGDSLDQGSEWTIAFNGKSEQLDALRVRVEESTANRVRFLIIEDESEIGKWMRWREVIWDLANAQNGTQLTMTVRYDRLLDPAWYFKPLERYGVHIAADYFLKSTFSHDHH